MARGINKAAIVSAYASGASIPEVAAEFGVSRSTVRLAALNAGVLRTRAAGVRLAAKAGKVGVHRKGIHRKFSDEHRAAIRDAAIRRGRERGAGFSVKPNGYVEFTRGPHKGRAIHRVVAEQMIGRPLARDEVVHHKDGNRQNNRPENLQVMTRAEHTRLHRQETLNGKGH